MNVKKIIAIISVLFIFTVCTVSGAGGDSVYWSSPYGYIVENTSKEEVEKLLDEFWLQLKNKYGLTENRPKYNVENIKWREGKRRFRIHYVYDIIGSRVKIDLGVSSQSSIWKKRSYNKFCIYYTFVYWEFPEDYLEQRKTFEMELDNFINSSNLSIKKVSTESQEWKPQ